MNSETKIKKKHKNAVIVFITESVNLGFPQNFNFCRNFWSWFGIRMLEVIWKLVSVYIAIRLIILLFLLDMI